MAGGGQATPLEISALNHPVLRLDRDRPKCLGAAASRISLGELLMGLLNSGVGRFLRHLAAMPLAFPVVDFVVIIGAHRHASIALYKRQLLGAVSRGLPVMRVAPAVDKYTPVSVPRIITWIK